MTWPHLPVGQHFTGDARALLVGPAWLRGTPRPHPLRHSAQLQAHRQAALQGSELGTRSGGAAIPRHADVESVRSPHHVAPEAGVVAALELHLAGGHLHTNACRSCIVSEPPAHTMSVRMRGHNRHMQCMLLYAFVVPHVVMIAKAGSASHHIILQSAVPERLKGQQCTRMTYACMSLMHCIA